MSFRRVVVLAAALATSVAMAQDAPQPAAQSSAATATATTTAPASTPAVAAAAASAPATAMSAPANASSTAAATTTTAATALAPLSGDPAAGQAKAAVCGACHGADGNSTLAQYPKLAGQNEPYIVEQLINFKTGERQNAIMAGFAAPLSPQDMHDLGAWFASQKPLPGVADKALVEAGGTLYREGDAERGIPACMSCHGPDGHGNLGPPYPQLAGQHADYVQKTLQAWHDGESWGADAHAQIMPAIAKKLDSKDIAALASYIEGLHTNEIAEDSSR